MKLQSYAKRATGQSVNEFNQAAMKALDLLDQMDSVAELMANRNVNEIDVCVEVADDGSTADLRVQVKFDPR